MTDSRDGSEDGNHLSDRELDYDEDDAPSDNGHHESFHSENGLNDDDLYDAVLEPTANNEKHDNVSVVSSAPPTSTVLSSSHVSSTSSSSLNSGKRYCCYVGNMTWWTTDEDITNLVKELGVHDLMDIKFYENRNNGQSKGYALVMFASDPSVKTCIESLPSRLLHNQQLVVLPYTKASLAKFEEATKRMEQRNEKKEQKPEKQPGFVGTVRLGVAAPPGTSMGQMSLNQMRPQFTGPAVPLMRAGAVPGVGSVMPLARTVNLSGPPPQSMSSMNRPPPSYVQQSRPLNQPPPNFPPPGAHINPNVYPGFGGMPPQPTEMSEAEIEEVMGRNRTVASSAVTRAVQDATSGDYQSAIETMMTAMNLIRASRAANDERCKALVNSLQDTLQGLETKAYSSGSSRKHRSSGRDRDRSRDRSGERSRKRHRRSRSRSHDRSRDRYDDRYDRSSRSPPRYRSSRH
ncbi:hypothetical protein L596_006243 [Steinernema carpocapsae]|uniref:RRM domain-containing protein n=1 Tax=Steinernema carpocapsae TaxID=34508 RepID=A0A4U8V1Q3_STECR|nr:hypothetical protein L596_006243 [Steinernema carpocapsae]